MPIESKERITSALIIAEPWIGFILAGRKTWEMRSKAVRKRGRIGLIRKGSGLVVGEATLIDSLPALNEAEMLASIGKHCIPADMIRSGEVSKWRYPWVLADVVRYVEPRPYKHPSGAVTWVDV
jgi:hypothetical protein